MLIVETASFNATSAAALSLFATAASTFFIEVLTADLIALFLAALVLFTKILFLADFNVSQFVHLQFNSIKYYYTPVIETDTGAPMNMLI